MSGAEVVIISKGAQDVYIRDKFSSKVNISQYSRITNFAQRAIQCPWQNGDNITNNQLSVVKIPRKGDMLTYMWLEGNDIVTNLEGTTFSLYL